MKIEKANSNDIQIIETKLKGDMELEKQGVIFNPRNIYTATINDSMVGYYSISQLEGFPEPQIVVFKEYRNKGYGNIMLDSICNMLFESGYEEIRLKIKDSNKASLRIAKKNGFRPETENFYDAYYSQNDNNEWVIMSKTNLLKRKGR